MSLLPFAAVLAAVSSSALAAPAGKAARDVEARPELFIHFRPEVRTNPSFAAAAQDDHVLNVQQTLRAGAWIRKGPVGARVSLQDVRAWGTRASSTSTEPNAFAYEGYLHVDTGEGWLRVGRQEVHLMNGFYFSRAPWNPAGRSFDGVRWQQPFGEVFVEAAGLMLVDPFPARVPENSDEVGVPASSFGDGMGLLRVSWTGGELIEPTFLIVAHYGDATPTDPDRDKRWVAPGGRIHLKTDQTEVDLNGLVQLGRDGDTPRRAHSIILHARQAIAGPVGLALQFDQSSGHACAADSPEDSCAPADGVLRDFDLQFGRNHALRGQADLAFGANTRQIGLGPTAQVSDTVSVILLPQLFQLTNPEGAWRRIGGVMNGSGFIEGNDRANVGIEVDALAEWNNGKGLIIDGGWTFYQPIGAGAEMTEGGLQTFGFVRNRFSF